MRRICCLRGAKGSQSGCRQEVNKERQAEDYGVVSKKVELDGKHL